MDGNHPPLVSSRSNASGISSSEGPEPSSVAASPNLAVQVYSPAVLSPWSSPRSPLPLTIALPDLHTPSPALSADLMHAMSTSTSDPSPGTRLFPSRSDATTSPQLESHQNSRSPTASSDSPVRPSSASSSHGDLQSIPPSTRPPSRSPTSAAALSSSMTCPEYRRHSSQEQRDSPPVQSSALGRPTRTCVRHTLFYFKEDLVTLDVRWSCHYLRCSRIN